MVSRIVRLSLSAFVVVTMPTALALTVAGLTGCGNDSALGDAPTLTGHLDGWTHGEGAELQLHMEFPGVNTKPDSTGTIDASGDFSIVLPGSAAIAPNLLVSRDTRGDPLPGCTVDVKVVPTDYAVIGFDGLQAQAGALKISYLETTSEAVVRYLYVDRDVDITGPRNCPVQTSAPFTTTTFDIHFKLGWNRLVDVEAKDTNPNKEYTGADPNGDEWVALPP